MVQLKTWAALSSIFCVAAGMRHRLNSPITSISRRTSTRLLIGCSPKRTGCVLHRTEGQLGSSKGRFILCRRPQVALSWTFFNFPCISTSALEFPAISLVEFFNLQFCSIFNLRAAWKYERDRMRSATYCLGAAAWGLRESINLPQESKSRAWRIIISYFNWKLTFNISIGGVSTIYE